MNENAARVRTLDFDSMDEGGVADLLMSPDGRSLFTRRKREFGLTAWDVETGELRHQLDHDQLSLELCAASPAGDFVAGIGENWFAEPVLIRWDPETGEEIDRSELSAPAPYPGYREDPMLETLRVSSDGSFLVYPLGSAIYVLDSSTGALRASLEAGSITALALSPDDSFIASARWNELLRLEEQELDRMRARNPRLPLDFGTIWDTESGTERARMGGHDLNVRCLAIGPGGSYIVSGGDDETVRLWDPESGEPESVRQRPRLPAGVTDLSGEWYTAAVMGDRGPVLDCASSPDGTFIVSVCNSEWRDDRGPRITLWHTETGRGRARFALDANRIDWCEVSPDGSLIVAAGGSDMGVLEIREEIQIGAASLPAPLTSFVVNPQRPTVACGAEDGNVYLIDLEGVEYGPTIVTAIDNGSGPLLRCRGCLEQLALQTDWLGEEITCPRDACGTRMRVNSFVGGSRGRLSAGESS